MLHRFLFWLFVVFAVGEAPFAANQLFSSAQQRGVCASREFRADELPARYLAPVETLALSESAESDRSRLAAFAGDCDDGASGILLGPPAFAGERLAAFAFAGADQITRYPAAGFSSRAPPAVT